MPAMLIHVAGTLNSPRCAILWMRSTAMTRNSVSVTDRKSHRCAMNAFVIEAPETEAMLRTRLLSPV